MKSISSRIGLLILSFMTTVIVIAGLGYLPSIPPVGDILNPYSGIWRNHARIEQDGENLEVKGLKAPVEVFFDEYDIPHIFADSDHDLYIAQGYIVARDRLFLMDLNARLGAAELSEMVGQRAVAIDEYFIRLGFRETVQVDTEEALKDEATRLATESFAKGVNGFLATLDRFTLPIEYKILGVKPKPWRAQRATELLMSMTFRLSGMSSDVTNSWIRKKFGAEAFSEVVDFEPFDSDPIVFDRKSWPLASAVKPPKNEQLFQSVFFDYRAVIRPSINNGSNNWALAADKSKTGYPIVSNDTHLNYSLPPIWYEMQLHSPNQNVYGATIPGAPGILVGFNKDVAWAVTNATIDGRDLYEVRTRKNGTEYFHNGQWKPLQFTEHKIKIKGRGSQTVKLGRTHHGFVLSAKEDKRLVGRWTAHEPSNELRTFLQLNKAKSFDSCWRSLKHYTAPAQNFICADIENIGIQTNGLLAKKWRGQGSEIMDGSDPDNDWKEWVPFEQMPHMRPSNGFVRSANQNPVDENYPFYTGAFFDDSYRAQRIREALSSDQKFDWKDMERLQHDVEDALAKKSLPRLISHLDADRLSPKERDVLATLKHWDYRFDAAAEAPSIYYFWWRQLNEKLWKDQLEDNDRFLYRAKNLEVMEDPKKYSRWVDDISTDKVETLADIVTAAFQDAVVQLEGRIGPWKKGTWTWGQVNVTSFPHVLKVPGLGSEEMHLSGTHTTVNANYGVHGPTWKMIVELGPMPRAFTRVPGGQVGNPMDQRYGKNLEEWSRGELKPVKYFKNRSEAEGLRRLVLMPAKG